MGPSVSEKFLANEQENIFGGQTVKVWPCLVRILKSSTCKHVTTDRRETGDRTMKTALPGLLELPVVRVNAGGMPPRQPLCW